MSSAGQEFAEALYSGNSLEGEEEPIDLDEPLPKWALKMLSMVPTTTTPADVFSASERIEVRIENDERSWERFYAFTIDPTSFRIQQDMTFQKVLDESAPFRVQPWSGQLAPRGGSPNLCDPSKPYSDSDVLEIVCTSSTSKDFWLVVGTEADQWYYRIEK